MSVVPTFQGEVQFVTFSDSSKGGPRITLRLAERDELEAFVGKEAKRFMCVLVEIGDDEQPVEKHASEAFRSDPKVGPLTKSAGIICKEAKFQRYACEAKGYEESEAGAAEMVREFCDVASRKDLDTTPMAATRYPRLMENYRDWLRQSAVQEPVG